MNKERGITREWTANERAQNGWRGMGVAYRSDEAVTIKTEKKAIKGKTGGFRWLSGPWASAERFFVLFYRRSNNLRILNKFKMWSNAVILIECKGGIRCS